MLGEGFEFVECNVSWRPRTQTFRIYIDSESGVPVEACARVSRRISQELDTNPLLEGSYSIEVSSPGMNRKIWKRDHFERFRGERARIELRMSGETGRVLHGDIGEVEEEGFELILEGGGARRVRFDEIDEARLRLDPWKRRPKQGG